MKTISNLVLYFLSLLFIHACSPANILAKICTNQKYLLGEFVVVMGAEKNIENIEKNYIGPEIENIIKRLLTKFSLTESVEIVHKISYIEKKQIYKKALDIKNENNK